MVLGQLDELFLKMMTCLESKLKQTVFDTGQGSSGSECVNLMQRTVKIITVLKLQNVVAPRSVDWIALLLHVSEA
jgi:hypothetical protein